MHIAPCLALVEVFLDFMMILKVNATHCVAYLGYYNISIENIIFLCDYSNETCYSRKVFSLAIISIHYKI